jgi:asparagine synthase (glutamine-hydrolysing)
MGIKPLLYAETNDAVYFSSELKPLLDFDINREIDQTALENYFAYTYIPAPLTIFKSVKKNVARRMDQNIQRRCTKRNLF